MGSLDDDLHAVRAALTAADPSGDPVRADRAMTDELLEALDRIESRIANLEDVVKASNGLLDAGRRDFLSARVALREALIAVEA